MRTGPAPRRGTLPGEAEPGGLYPWEAIHGMLLYLEGFSRSGWKGWVGIGLCLGLLQNNLMFGIYGKYLFLGSNITPLVTEF